MADLKIFDLSALTVLASDDVFPIVDVSDTTGNLGLWHSSETATTTSVEVGSSLVVIKTA